MEETLVSHTVEKDLYDQLTADFFRERGYIVDVISGKLA